MLYNQWLYLEKKRILTASNFLFSYKQIDTIKQDLSKNVMFRMFTSEAQYIMLLLKSAVSAMLGRVIQSELARQMIFQMQSVTSSLPG